MTEDWDYRDQNRNRRSRASGVPIVGKYISDPYKALAAETFKQAGAGIDRYRAALPQAYSNAWANSQQLYQPMNEAMGRIYGSSAMMNPQGMQPVITPGMLAVTSEDVNRVAEDEASKDNPSWSRGERRERRRQARRQRRQDRRDRRRDRAQAGPPGQRD